MLETGVEGSVGVSSPRLMSLLRKSAISIFPSASCLMTEQMNSRSRVSDTNLRKYKSNWTAFNVPLSDLSSEAAYCSRDPPESSSDLACERNLRTSPSFSSRERLMTTVSGVVISSWLMICYGVKGVVVVLFVWLLGCWVSAVVVLLGGTVVVAFD